jgi:hypothetical protein
LKASIQTLSQLKTDYERQRRDWILAFYDSAVEMLYEKLSVNFGEMPYDDGRSLFEFQQSYGALLASMLKEYQRIVLYFEYNDPLRVSAEEVITAVLGTRRLFRERISKLKSALIEEGLALRAGNRQQMDEAVKKSNAAAKAYWDVMGPATEAFQSSLRTYLTNVNKFLRGAGSTSDG